MPTFTAAVFIIAKQEEENQMCIDGYSKYGICIQWNII